MFARRHHCRKARIPLPFLDSLARACNRCVGMEIRQEQKAAKESEKVLASDRENRVCSSL